MDTALLIKEIQTLEIAKYKKHKDNKRIMATHVAFSGSPRKHPYDANKIVLVADPFSQNNQYYEFNIDAIAYVEGLPS